MDLERGRISERDGDRCESERCARAIPRIPRVIVTCNGPRKTHRRGLMVPRDVVRVLVARSVRDSGIAPRDNLPRRMCRTFSKVPGLMVRQAGRLEVYRS